MLDFLILAWVLNVHVTSSMQLYETLPYRILKFVHVSVGQKATCVHKRTDSIAECILLTNFLVKNPMFTRMERIC